MFIILTRSPVIDFISLRWVTHLRNLPNRRQLLSRNSLKIRLVSRGFLCCDADDYKNRHPLRRKFRQFPASTHSNQSGQLPGVNQSQVSSSQRPPPAAASGSNGAVVTSVVAAPGPLAENIDVDDLLSALDGKWYREETIEMITARKGLEAGFAFPDLPKNLLGAKVMPISTNFPTLRRELLEDESTVAESSSVVIGGKKRKRNIEPESLYTLLEEVVKVTKEHSQQDKQREEERKCKEE
nr:hypothetical protein Iba_chr04bCG7240 [Ipomoea batatas]